MQYLNNNLQKEFEKDLNKVLEEIREILIYKNKKYGNSALEPIKIFSKTSSTENIKSRIDEKLNRIKNNTGDDDEDATTDLLGYLILLKISEKND